MDQRVIRQPSTIEIITTAESTTDNFRLQVPQGWIIQHMNNTGAALVSETLEGFRILAQLCPEERQEVTPPNEDINISRSTSPIMSDNDSCRDTQQEVIHIVRYPNLGAKLGFDPEDIVTNEDITTEAILDYQMQKLQQVGYRDIRIIDSADTAINIDINADLSGNDTIVATVPAKLVEMTYSTDLDPSETKTGYFISTATAATPRNLGMVTGDGIFYEGTASPPLPATTNIAEEDGGEEPVQTDISSIVSPEPVREVFDTFELIARAEAVEEGVVVEEGEELVGLLTVEVITNDTEGEAPATFVFEADTIGGTEPYTVTWDFDDDDDSAEETEEQTILHTFDEAGTYNVTVDVLYSEEETASDSIEIIVEEASAEEEI
ncbi:MAG TPA: PKD domain-containing protein [Nitrososphaera sp.]|nr:PKD domain-containing protein [Nitrososphaera sp.]